MDCNSTIVWVKYFVHSLSVLCLLPVVHHLTMVYKALSEQVKWQKATTHENVQMCQAIDIYQQQEFKPKNGCKSYCQVADEFYVSKSTLQHLVMGGWVSMSAFNGGKQRLTPAEECVLVDFSLESADQGFHSHMPTFTRQLMTSSHLAWGMSMFHLDIIGLTISSIGIAKNFKFIGANLWIPSVEGH